MYAGGRAESKNATAATNSRARVGERKERLESMDVLVP